MPDLINDTVPEPTPEPAKPAEPAATTPEPEVKSPSFKPEEIAAMQEDASLYRTIKADPKLSTMVLDYLKQQGVAPDGTPAKQQSEDDVRKELAQLKETMRDYITQQQIKEFRSSVPDFDQVRGDMAKVLQAHPTLDLQTAYRLVKAGSAASTPPAPAKSSKLEVPEGKATGRADNENDELKRIQEKIMDSKATPRTSDYLDLAMKYAYSKAQESEE